MDQNRENTRCIVVATNQTIIYFDISESDCWSIPGLKFTKRNENPRAIQQSSWWATNKIGSSCWHLGGDWHKTFNSTSREQAPTLGPKYSIGSENSQVL